MSTEQVISIDIHEHPTPSNSLHSVDESSVAIHSPPTRCELKEVVVDDSTSNCSCQSSDTAMHSYPEHRGAGLRDRRVSHRSWTRSLQAAENLTVQEDNVSLDQPPLSASSTTSDFPTGHPANPPPLGRSHGNIFQKLKPGLDQVTNFWESYNKKADFEDREFVKALGASLDVLLIFAGLFSGVNTPFILESMKTLQPDQAEMTNRLLSSIIIILQNPSDAEGYTPSDLFTPTQQAVRSSSIFFASLCCSLTAAFGAVLGKQWLNHYEREGRLKPPAERARERQKKSKGCAKWHLEGVIESLPTILQVSLFLFLAGLVDFLRAMNGFVGWVVTAFALILLFFHLFTITVATLDSTAPFQTRLSIILRDSVIQTLHTSWNQLMVDIPNKVHGVMGGCRRIIRAGLRQLLARIAEVGVQGTSGVTGHVHSLVSRLLGMQWRPASSASAQYPVELDRTNLECVVFLIRRASTPQDIDTLQSGMRTIPIDIQVDPHDPIIPSLVDALFNFLLKPVWNPFSHVVWGTSNLDFHALLNILYLVFVRWGYKHIPAPVSTASTMTDPGWVHGQSSYKYYLDDLFCTILAELWKVLSRDSLDNNSVKLIIAIVLQLRDTIEASPDRSVPQDLLLNYFENPAKDPALLLPYIDLLASEVFDNPTTPPARLLEANGIAHALISTMWSQDQGAWEPDLDYRRGRLRVEYLPRLVNGNLEEEDFSIYLLHWLKTHAKFNNLDSPSDSIKNLEMAPQAVESYLMALRNLIHTPGYPLSRLWSESYQLVEHPTCLMRIINGDIILPSSNRHNASRSRNSDVSVQLDALYCLIKLWNHSSQPETPGLISVVVEFLVRGQDRFSVMDRALISTKSNNVTYKKRSLSAMEAIILFLEMMSYRGRLTQGMETAIGGCQRLGLWILSKEQQHHLDERLGRLQFQ